MRAEAMTGPVNAHGEGPVWSPRWAGVRWVDMSQGYICELAGDDTVLRHRVGPIAAVIRPRTAGGHVVVGERGLLLADDDALDAPLQPLPEVWSDPSVRMNEGGCDPAGNLYAGSMAYDGRPGAGRLYRFDTLGRPTVVLPEVSVSNGLEWSPDGARAYYADTPTGRIDVFDWTETDGLTNRRPFTTSDGADGAGRPDGLTVDAEGGVWSARWGGSAVHRYDPDGRLDLVVELPTSHVTAVTFYGPDLDQLLITTSTQGLDREAEPLAGALFTIRPGVTGRPVREFAG